MTSLIIFIITSVVLTVVANSAKNSAEKKRVKPMETETLDNESMEVENPLQRMVKTLEKELMIEQNPDTQEVDATVINDNDLAEPNANHYDMPKPIVMETLMNDQEKESQSLNDNNKNHNTNQQEHIMDDFTVEKAIIYSALLRPKYLDL